VLRGRYYGEKRAERKTNFPPIILKLSWVRCHNSFHCSHWDSIWRNKLAHFHFYVVLGRQRSGRALASSSQGRGFKSSHHCRIRERSSVKNVTHFYPILTFASNPRACRSGLHLECKVFNCDKHTSLSRQGINYKCKKFMNPVLAQ
jgi:hypothetical protein